ncbi:MAG TPA: VC0807 family protein [Pseudonocardia sp.]|jgi:hypothetical protein|nr:VC0807 family protein [Pseudonocardia sp.]
MDTTGQPTSAPVAPTGQPVTPARPGTPVGPAAESKDPVRLRRMISSLAWDVGPSVAAYYGARALGCSDYVSLLAGTVASALRLIWVAVRDRRVDAFAMFLMVLFGVGLALTFVTGDARFVIVKDSLTSFVAGLFFLGSCALGRPLTYYAAQRFAGPAEAVGLRARFADPAVRRRYYATSLVWGGGLLAESLLRIPLVLTLPIDVAVGASTVLMIVAYTLLIGWTIHFASRGPAA